jgi:hypothetical protein
MGGCKMEQLAKYLVLQLKETGCLSNSQKYLENELKQALSLLTKQDLLKMLDVKECQCKESKN